MRGRDDVTSSRSRHNLAALETPAPLELVIVEVENTGEGISEGLTLHVKGFPDSGSIGRYFSDRGLRPEPIEPEETDPPWWDLFLGHVDAGIAYAPQNGISRIEIESSAALAKALPLATIEGHIVFLGGTGDLTKLRERLPAGYDVDIPERPGSGRMAFEFRDASRAQAFYRESLASGYVAVATRDIAATIDAYIGRHHLAAHEDSHHVRRASIAAVAILAAAWLTVGANSLSDGKLFKTVHRAAVALKIHKEPAPAYIVGDVSQLARARNVLALGSVYLEFPERAVQGRDTVAVEIPTLTEGDRVYMSATMKPDSTGGIVQIIVARITDAKGEAKYEHPDGALPVLSYKLTTPAEWGAMTQLESFGPDYAAELEARMASSKRIRVTGMLTRTAGGSGAGYAVVSGPNRIILGGTIDALTSARLEQFRDTQVDLVGNMVRIFPGAYRHGKPTGEPMIEVNPHGVAPATTGDNHG